PIICVEAADTRLFDEIFAFLKPFGYLPGEPFNITPTHIFQTDATDAAFKTSVAHFMARAHIDLMRLDGGLRRQVADQYQRIGALEKERLPALAADAGALKAQLNAVSETMEQQSAAADNVREGMRDELGRMAETVDALEARLPVQLGAAIERTAKDLCDRFETLDAAVAHIPPLLRALDAEQEGRLSALPEAVLERLRRRIDGLDDAAAQTLALLRRLTNDDVETTAATRLDLNRLLARLLDRDGALLANIQSRVDASLDQSADRLHGRFELLEQAAARLFARIEQPQESGAKTDALREAIGAVESRLIALADMRQRLEALTAFEARLSALDALSARIDESGERVGARIEAALHVLPFARQEEQRVLGEAVARLQAELPDAVAEAIRREIATVSARTESQIDALEQRLSRAQASQSEALAQVARALQQHSAQQAAIAATFADMQASQARLQTQIEAQQARLESLDSQWAEQLGFQAAEIVTRIESHLDGAVLALGAHPDSPPPPADLQSGAPLAAAAAPAPSTAPALATRSLAQFHCGADWRQIWPHQDVALMSEGRVLVRQTKSTPGIVSAAFAAPEGGGVLRIRVTAAVPAHSASKPHVRLCDSEGARMGPDMPLREGASEHFFFLSRRVKQVKAYVIVHQPSENYSFAIQDITIDAVEAESYFAQQRAQIAAPVIASLATIPSRLPMLHDCVESLLVQADTVRVFLNGYDHVPEFLRHPRVEFRRSQDWDDKGDAGKFGWIESHDAPGYRLIVDDDLLFPPDFAANMAAAVKRHQDRAICALHGILLKQPITQYYDPKSRTAFHFQNALAHERTCHVLGSNAMCFHSAAVRMRWADFMFRNMGDIWLAGYAQQHKLPMIAVARPAYWVRQNQQKERFDTIYDHSLKRSGSRFDSSAVQDALVKHMAPLTMQPTSRPKIVFVVLAEDAQRVAALLRQWKDKRKLDIDWAVIAIALEDD
ncbi:MAG: hypothetical protein AB7O04_16165, partial [Hyphomonadaceae bacterium]